MFQTYKRRNLLSKSADTGGDDTPVEDSGALSDNSSSDYDSQSPPPPSLPQSERGASRSPLRRISPTPRPRAAPEDREVTARDNPLYQLQLTSVKVHKAQSENYLYSVCSAQTPTQIEFVAPTIEGV